MELDNNFRNNIISILELWSSQEAQLNYQNDVPFADVTVELFCQWCDDYYDKNSPIIKGEFSIEEIKALERFDEAINRISDNIPAKQLPNIEEFVKTIEWKTINQAAITTLTKIIR